MKKNLIYLAAFLISTIVFLSCKKEYNPKDEGGPVPKTVDLDAILPSITVNGTQLHSEAFGNPSDPIVVFLHRGPSADYRSGLNVKNLVNDHYYVVFYDQRGTGLSKRHPKDSYTIQLMLDDLTAVINYYRKSPSQKVFLFGHSWGAMLATAYVNSYPASVNGIVLAEPGGLTWNQVKNFAEKSRTIKLFDEATNDAVYHDQFLTGSADAHAIIDYKWGLSSAYSWRKGNEEGIEGPVPFWRYGAASFKRFMELGKKEGFDFTTNLRQFTTKVLFLYSSNNKIYGQAYAHELASSFYKVQVSEVQGAGHDMIYSKWEKVYPLVLPYLNGLR